MKLVLSVAFLLLLLSLPTLAGEYIMNDTGHAAYGLRVTFSEPVTITAFGDDLSVIDPTVQATTFTFSGGAVSTSGGEWLNWSPASASILTSEWLATCVIAPPTELSSAISNASAKGLTVVLFDETHDPGKTMLCDRAEALAKEANKQPLDFVMCFSYLEPSYAWMPSTTTLTDDLVRGADALAFASPRADLSTDEFECIRQYLSDGGVVILFGDSGYSPPERFGELLLLFGLSLDGNQHVRSRNAWDQTHNVWFSGGNGEAVIVSPTQGSRILLQVPYVAMDPATQSLLVIARRDSGTLVLFADDAIPGEPDYTIGRSFEGNMEFLQTVLEVAFRESGL